MGRNKGRGRLSDQEVARAVDAYLRHGSLREAGDELEIGKQAVSHRLRLAVLRKLADPGEIAEARGRRRTRKVPDETLRKAASAYMEHGTAQRAAEALGMPQSTLDGLVRKAISRGVVDRSEIVRSVSRVKRAASVEGVRKTVATMSRLRGDRVAAAEELGITLAAISTHLRRAREAGIEVPHYDGRRRHSEGPPPPAATSVDERAGPAEMLVSAYPDIFDRAARDGLTATARETGVAIHVLVSAISKAKAEGVLPETYAPGGKRLSEAELVHTVSVLRRHGGRRAPAASELGLTVNALHARLRRAEESGMAVPPPPPPARTRKRRSCLEDRELRKTLAAYEESGSLQRAGTALGISGETVRARLRKAASMGIVPATRTRS